ncbi:hypothetical protein MUA90_05690 [Staphylococcus sp. IVB6181]|uniref:hypothetical protein n=1 Tax=Staphylococcus sp. IVB6181 TaxID=2929481 RepID=UPI0021CFEDF1|nr:hypothetical protein [Staphylococcus sp. IVB6181]UXV34503.1 hypothetical protein MUA90_10805 [Staphylococcus sp. IVB6181]UXV35961.1 hypothetical protein MUA90_05690 [Staphylococcus sp. IVB6181]
MEDILFTIILIVAIICYTVYKIDSNHVNRPESHRISPKPEKEPTPPKKDKGTRMPPGKERE